MGWIRPIKWCLWGSLWLALCLTACGAPEVVEPTSEMQATATLASGAGETPSFAPTEAPYPVNTLPPIAPPDAYPAPGGEATNSAEPTPATPSEPTPQPAPTTITYTIQRGDALQAIADAYGVTLEELMAANNLTDPNQIVAGQTLTIPIAAAVQGVHTVQTGETLSGIAQQYGVAWSDIAALNGLPFPYTLYAGQELLIPAP